MTALSHSIVYVKYDKNMSKVGTQLLSRLYKQSTMQNGKIKKMEYKMDVINTLMNE